MAKLTDRTELAEAPNNSDLIHIVDVSDTTDDAGGTSKYITVGNLAVAGPAGADGADGATGPAGPAGPAGADGATGATGPAGADGADGADGVAGGSMSWQGAWVTATAYTTDDSFEHNGSTYIVTSDHTSGASTEPGVGGSWATVMDLVAAKGADGADGATGATGPAGADGANGADGADAVTASIAETDTGTDDAKAVTPDGLAGSYAGSKCVSIMLTEPATDCTTGDGKAYFMVPAELDGMNLVDVKAGVATAGTTGTHDLQIHNVTDAVDMLSTKLTLDSTGTTSETAATAAVINAANDDVAEGDILRIDCDAIQTTAAKGDFITLVFRLP